MKLIVGLGNPGEKYDHTRHNVGYMVLDQLASEISGEWLMNKYTNSLVIDHQSFILAKPQTFMNNSGEAVSALLKFYELQHDNLVVIHDDLDIALGQYKIQMGKGPKVHNGVNSIENHLKTEQFTRVRIGVDNRDPNNRIPGAIYVLEKMSMVDQMIIEPILPNITRDIMNIVHE